MKKSILLLTVTFAIFLQSGFAQITEKPGATTSNPQSTNTSSTNPTSANQQTNSNTNTASDVAKEWTRKMDEVCDLNATQERQILEINMRFARKLQELKEKYHDMDHPSADAAKSEKDQLTEQRFKEYANVLTKEQMQLFKEYRRSLKGNDEEAHAKNEEKDKYQNATPDEKEKMKEEKKEKKEK